MTMPEIEVFGAGAFGLATAYCLLRKGARVRVIEKRRVGAGSSGGVVGALAPHTPDNWNEKKQFQFDSLIAAREFWAEVDALSGVRSGYGRTGRLMAISDDRQLELARGRSESARQFWQGLAEWQVIPSAEAGPFKPVSPTGHVVRETLSARMSPAGACASLAGAIRALGGEIIEGTTTGKGGDAAVYCTGYEGLEELSAELGAPIGKGIKGQGLLLAFDAAGQPQLFAEGRHIIPHENGTVAIGSTTENEWDDPVSVDDQLDAIHEHALQICPLLHGAKVLKRWAGVRPRGRRRAPILDRHPLRENVYIANGGFKIGFGMAVGVGRAMADLVLEGKADIPDSFTLAANMG